ncbi:HEPN family nuclease [Pelagibaculum spongiae]|uniref:pEK499-p136 HEPN domain-containing protein n=1 Tax=Pelagibaculum spongiae TaxID=2080658 RepID=A0A2V1GVV4_9GAMM|nr:HEPN family nuclease [Pelagibaculum spongiae]PVZ63941.1 hypothetical protein DC094_20690 [Pelagibaculum spongiae]
MNEENVKSIIALQRINNQLLGLVDSAKCKNDIKLREILDQLYAPYEKVESDYRNNHSFYNQYQFISSLYTYIVLPKESFFDSIPDDIETNSLKTQWGINKLQPSYKLKYFLRRLRNAVSHGEIEFTETIDFIFTDKNPRNKSDVFQVKLSVDELMNFTQALAYWCMTKDIELKELKKHNK